jgi:hypothetical protein
MIIPFNENYVEMETKMNCKDAGTQKFEILFNVSDNRSEITITDSGTDINT